MVPYEKAEEWWQDFVKEKAGGVEPPFTELIRKTHTRRDGTFVDCRAEAIVNEVERVKSNRGRIYGLKSNQFEGFDPSELVAVSLARNVSTEMRMETFETTVSTILESQKVILTTLGINHETNQPFATPSPHVAASNSTPQTSPNLTAQSVNRELRGREEGDAREKEDDGEVGHVLAVEDDGYGFDEDDDNDKNEAKISYVYIRGIGSHE
ncbi:unnamed protein product [Cochlearia groenlandica]